MLLPTKGRSEQGERASSVVAAALGWYGVLALLGSYFLVSFAVISPDSITYQVLNLTGAIGIIVLAWQKRAYQPAVLNMVWAGIALVALIRVVV